MSMRVSRYLFPCLGTVSAGFIGYYAGKRSSAHNLQKEETWKKMDQKYFGSFFPHVLKYAPWGELSKETARDSLSGHLDASRVPHGDIAVPSKNIHSGRYIISQWQRVATGAAVIVLGRDINGDLCVALGPQRGKMVQAQGYMESSLPKEDLTGLREQGASRINGSTGEKVKADDSLEDNAVREVWEELGLPLQKKNLKLIDLSSSKDANPIVHTITAHYATNLENTPELQTLDTEFAEDDMAKPNWYKIKNIRCTDSKCYVDGSKFQLHPDTVSKLQKALNDSELVSKSDKKASNSFLQFKPEIPTNLKKC